MDTWRNCFYFCLFSLLRSTFRIDTLKTFLFLLYWILVVFLADSGNFLQRQSPEEGWLYFFFHKTHFEKFKISSANFWCLLPFHFETIPKHRSHYLPNRREGDYCSIVLLGWNRYNQHNCHNRYHCHNHTSRYNRPNRYNRHNLYSWKLPVRWAKNALKTRPPSQPILTGPCLLVYSLTAVHNRRGF